jgi:hypothetical protein
VLQIRLARVMSPQSEHADHWFVKAIIWLLPGALFALEWIEAITTPRIPFSLALLYPSILFLYLTVFTAIFGARMHKRRREVEDTFRPSSGAVVWTFLGGLLSWIPAWALVDFEASDQAHNCFSVALSRIDAFYLAIGIFTTNGTGDISPSAQWCHILISTQMGVNWIVIVIDVTIVVGTMLALAGDTWRKRSRVA